MESLNTFLFGFGKMGKRVAHILEARGHTLASSLNEADVCIDFSSSSAVLNHIEMACKASVPIVIGTTGWEKELPFAEEVVKQSKNAALYAPNFSLGIALFRKLLKEARALFADYDAAGIEFHHREKKDSPSGTAKMIRNDIELSKNFSSVRIGSVVGKHEVIFDSPVDSITLSHEAKNREGFAIGAVKAAEWIVHQKGWFTLDDMLYSVDYSLQ